MTLFSTLNQPLILWFFCYLGFVSGLIFFSVFKLTNLLKDAKILKKDLTNKEEKKEKTDEKKRLKFFKMLSKNIRIILQFILRILSIILSTITFFIVILLSFYLNLIFNYGEITFINVIIYSSAFFLSNIFLKMVAKFLFNFYNERRARRVKTSEN